MTEYVLGFLFDPDFDDVVLIEKKRPTWQKGKLNGVGGKIEVGETPRAAMRREFMEETGHERDDWEHFATMPFNDAVVYCFRAFDTEIGLDTTMKTMTDERVVVTSIGAVTSQNAISNLQWLIPMALSDNRSVYTITEAST